MRIWQGDTEFDTATLQAFGLHSSPATTSNPLYAPSSSQQWLALLLGATACSLNHIDTAPLTSLVDIVCDLAPRLATKLRSNQFGFITFIPCDPETALLYRLPSELLFAVISFSAKTRHTHGLFNLLIASSNRLMPSGQLVIDSSNSFKLKSVSSSEVLQFFHEEFGLVRSYASTECQVALNCLAQRPYDLESLIRLRLDHNYCLWLPGGEQVGSFMVWRNATGTTAQAVSSIRQSTLLWQCARQALNKSKFSVCTLAVLKNH